MCVLGGGGLRWGSGEGRKGRGGGVDMDMPLEGDDGDLGEYQAQPAAGGCLRALRL